MLKLKWNTPFYPLLMSMLAIILFSVGCSVEGKDDGNSSRDDDQVSPIKKTGRIDEAITVLDAAKSCQNAQDCYPVDEDCCGTGKFFVVNRASVLQAKGLVRSQCKPQLEKDKELCKDKNRAALPQVECLNSRCAIKGAEGAAPGGAPAPAALTDEQKAECKEKDVCLVVYKDICNTRDEPVAVNFRYSTILKREIVTARKAKLKEDKNFCANKRPPDRFNPPVAKCVEGRCKIE